MHAVITRRHDSSSYAVDMMRLIASASASGGPASSREGAEGTPRPPRCWARTDRRPRDLQYARFHGPASFLMPVVQWVVRLGYTVEARDGELGVVREIFEGPAQSLFLSTDSYMRVVERGQPDLFIPFTEIVDVGDIKQTVYLKRWLNEINALGWTRDPHQPGGAAVPWF